MHDTPKNCWLPVNHDTEFARAMDLLEYATKNNSYDISPFAFSKGINNEAIENLAQLDIPGLPDACAIALHLVKKRRQKVHAFAILCWQDIGGQYWQEVQEQDKITGEWFVTSIDSLS
jgi:hypothetical protein